MQRKWDFKRIHNIISIGHEIIGVVQEIDIE